MGPHGPKGGLPWGQDPCVTDLSYVGGRGGGSGTALPHPLCKTRIIFKNLLHIIQHNITPRYLPKKACNPSPNPTVPAEITKGNYYPKKY